MPLRWLVARHLVAVKDDVEEDLTKIVGVMIIVQRLETAAVTWPLSVTLSPPVIPTVGVTPMTWGR